MRIPKFNVRFTVRSKLLLLSGILMVALVGSNLYMRLNLLAGGDALREQTEIQNTMRVATNSLRAFGELKFWLTDLEVSWLNESETNANQAQAALEKHLQELSAFAPEKAKKIHSEVEEFVALSIKAVDAYVDKNRVLGNSHAANARRKIEEVDAILVGILEDLKKKAETAEAAASKGAQTAAELSLFVLIGAGLLTVVLTSLTLRSVVTPMKKMVVAMTEVAEGKTDVEVPPVTKDEIGELAQALEVFKDNAIERDHLETAQAKEREAKEKRAQVIEQQSKDFDQRVTGVLDAVASSSTEMESTCQTMVATAEETNAQSNAVATASEQATSNVQTVASATEELSASIAEISKRVDQSTRIAQNAVEETEKTNATVEGLVEAAQKIGEVVDLINDIASQTNLLALNATIEAARAGDAGKGFAVVASEVKSLATQTAKATEEIGNQIGTMQNVTEEAVGAIKSIGAIIGEISEISTSIASSVEQQGAATQEIARNVQETAKGTQEVSENITGVTQAASETGSAATQMLNASGELSKQAESLGEEVKKFLADIKAA